METPLVTVYIPTYNRVALLKRAVESVCNQTYQNLEIIIVDDCSTDGTQQYLVQLSEKDNRIRYFLKESNSGACISRNIAINNASGKYITGLDDDDYFLSNRISTFVKNRYLLSQYKLLFTGLIFEKSKKRRKNYLIRPSKINISHLFYSNYIGNQVFCYTETLRSKGGFDENLVAWQDLDCWMSILKDGGHALYIHSYSYIVDDNDRVRITSGNKKLRIFEVYKYLIYKFGLTEKEAKIFSIALLGYDLEVKVKDLITAKLIHYFTFWFWYRFFSIYVKIIKSSFI